MRSLPTFRRHTDYTVYVEGWGLYSELVTRELGLYQDPWSNFGDWCRNSNAPAAWWSIPAPMSGASAADKPSTTCMTPASRNQVIKEVDRYLVMPGQATAYMMGMVEILKLREQARAALGEVFDIRAFHDALLRHGPWPVSTYQALQFTIATCQQQS